MADVLRQLDAEADAEYELESEEGALFTGTALYVGIMTMMVAALAFSYFYLRELDGRVSWDPNNLHPPALLGDLIGLCVLAGAVLVSFGYQRVRTGLAFEFTVAFWLAVGCALTGVGLQVWQLTRMGFYPGESGYTSVFVGFAMFNILMLFSAAYWTETLVARAVRLRRVYPPETFLGVSVRPEVRIWRASLRGAFAFWWWLLFASTFFWVLFYVL